MPREINKLRANSSSCGWNFLGNDASKAHLENRSVSLNGRLPRGEKRRIEGMTAKGLGIREGIFAAV